MANAGIYCLILFLLLSVSCKEDDFFRVTDVKAGAATSGDTPDIDGPLKKPGDGGGLEPEPESCKDFSGELAGKIKPEDIMTKLNYDESRLDDFICDNDKVVFCHTSPGNPLDASHFIEISDSDNAIETHLDKSGYDDDDVFRRSYLIKCSAFDELDVELEVNIGCSVICK